MKRDVWSLVLAGGDGKRLRELTTRPCGTVAPKQYCSLCGGQSLIEDALDRAAEFSAPERICTIVAQQHHHWWAANPRVEGLPPGNVIVQPLNRGTGVGVLYSILHLLARDPDARVLMLPADHYVRDEDRLRDAVRTAVAHVESDSTRPVLIGMEPDEVDPDLGYIMPGTRDAQGGSPVNRFVEKPELAAARGMIAAGGLWNTFILAADAQRLIDLFLPRYAPLVMEMQVILSRATASGSPTAGWPAIVDMYERLPEIDFSRDLLQGRESQLCVVRAPSCGWSDLGTPRRVGETLRRLRLREQMTPERDEHPSESTYVNLAAQHAQMEKAARVSY